MGNGEWRSGEIRWKTTGIWCNMTLALKKKKRCLGLKSQTLRNLWAPVLEAHLRSGYSAQQWMHRQVARLCGCRKLLTAVLQQQTPGKAERPTDGAKMHPGCWPPHHCSGCPFVYLLPCCWQSKLLAEDSPWWLPSPVGCHFLGTWVGCVCTGICTHALPADMHRVWLQSIHRVSS